MRTYLQFYDSNKKSQGLPWLAVLMGHMILDGPEVTTKDLRKKVKKENMPSVQSAAFVAKKRGWIVSDKSGTYWLTTAGRALWSKILDRELL